MIKLLKQNKMHGFLIMHAPYLGILWIRPGPKRLNATVTFMFLSSVKSSLCPSSIVLLWFLRMLLDRVTFVEASVTSMRPSAQASSVQ
jgi:hypothetical protein